MNRPLYSQIFRFPPLRGHTIRGEVAGSRAPGDVVRGGDQYAAYGGANSERSCAMGSIECSNVVQ